MVANRPLNPQLQKYSPSSSPFHTYLARQSVECALVDNDVWGKWMNLERWHKHSKIRYILVSSRCDALVYGIKKFMICVRYILVYRNPQVDQQRSENIATEQIRNYIYLMTCQLLAVSFNVSGEDESPSAA